jgi:peptidoglycan hydrolase-like protein with peptidoglycan-binding domain
MKISRKFNFFTLLLIVFLSVLSFSAVFFPTVSLAQGNQNSPTFVFLRDLRVGDRGEDVLELQKLLNSDPFTQVSTSGAGSPGLETMVFGPATHNAVLKFQQKHSNEVLRPAGLTIPSGFVGLWTRLKLNQILLNGQVAETPSDLVVNSTFGDSSENPYSEPYFEPEFVSDLPVTFTTLGDSDDSNELSLRFASNYYGGAGRSITLTGTGFTPETNMVIFDGRTAGNNKKYDIPNVPSSNGMTLRFQIPENIEPGRYDVTVKVGGSTSDPLPFMVTTMTSPTLSSLPKILNVEPKIAKFDEEITVTGENFTPTGNIVSSGFGVVRNIRSNNGTTLVFSIPMPEIIRENRNRNPEAEDWLWTNRLYVVNENGISAGTPVSELKIDLQ